jgi:hypothetical protein
MTDCRANIEEIERFGYFSRLLSSPAGRLAAKIYTNPPVAVSIW